MAWRRIVREVVKAMDRRSARWRGTRRVLVYVRSAMHVAVLEPITRELERDGRITVRYVCDRENQRDAIDRACGRTARWTTRQRAGWSAIDLLIASDPWSVPTLHRCQRRINFFHGVAGKYDLDDPAHLPIGFDLYDRVAFVNEERMRRYVARGVVRREAAVLVGFPRLDAVVNGRYDGAAVRQRLGLAAGRRTAIYAPTWSPASSLNAAGEQIIASLARSGWNVVIKPHAWSFDPDPKYSGGIDWRRRLRAIERAGQVVLCEDADASPLLAAADLMVTDHSSIGFEFCLLDRPVIVFDAPDLAVVARINPQRIAALRSAARVVRDPSEIGRAADEEMADAGRLRERRAAVARPLFHDPGRATERALDVVYHLLELRRRLAVSPEHGSAAPAADWHGARVNP
jgi:hypothetical protein